MFIIFFFITIFVNILTVRRAGCHRAFMPGNTLSSPFKVALSRVSSHLFAFLIWLNILVFFIVHISAAITFAQRSFAGTQFVFTGTRFVYGDKSRRHSFPAISCLGGIWRMKESVLSKRYRGFIPFLTKSKKSLFALSDFELQI